MPRMIRPTFAPLFMGWLGLVTLPFAPVRAVGAQSGAGPTCAPATARPGRGAEPASDPVTAFDSAWALIARTHWDSAGIGARWEAARTRLRPAAAAAKTRGELRGVLGALLDTLGQSHFRLIPEEEADGVATAAAEDRSGGVGLEFRLVDREVVVTAVDSAGPAWRAGIRIGWRLDAIAGCPMAPLLEEMRRTTPARHLSIALQQATMARLAGAPGSAVTLVLHDGRRTQRREVRREPVKGIPTKFGNLPPLVADLGWQRVRRNGRTFGVLRFPLWMPAIAPALDAALDSLRGSDGMIVDLRGNLGGVGGMVIGVGGHFLDTAVTLGTMRQRGSTFRFRANPRRTTADGRPVVPYRGPLVLLVDELSASTSEIFAAGMQAIGRARVIGVQTPGEALPAVPERLPNGDVLYHAIADFVSPRGEPIEGRGVLPDETVPLSLRTLRRDGDAPLEAALRWLLAQPMTPPASSGR